jgi:type I restriction enzyme S subunit
MAGDWRIATLGEIADASPHAFVDGPFGSNLPASCYTASGVPLIRGSNLSLGSTRFRSDEFVYVSDETASRLQRSCCTPLDIVFTKKGTLGQTGIIPEDSKHQRYLLSGNQMKLTVDRSKADPLFVFYFVSSPPSRAKIIRDSEVTGVPKTNLAYLRTFPIPLPPLAEQKAIAAVLGVLDDKIELNRRMNATLEAMARSLFQSWFVDFDPVRAKLDGRKPTGLDEATAALFPATFQDSEVGHLPQGWTARPLSDAIEVNPRRTLKAGAIAPYLDMKNLPTEGHCAVDIIDREFTSGTKFQRGDTLLARITPCLENGKTGYVDFLEDGQIGWGSTEYIVLAPKPPLPSQLGYLLARSEALRSHAIQNMTGTSGRQRVPSECFNNFFIAVPPSEVARRFDELTAPLMAKIKTSSDESRALATLRDTLLPNLLSGEIRTTNVRNNQTR